MIHKFVEFVPEKLEEGILYISLEYATALHKCFCGCGQEVVTPFSPTDWKLIFDGKTVSLHPSIGNWGFPCQSHYWIRNGEVEWAESWSSERIAAGRAHDRVNKTHYYSPSKSIDEKSPSQETKRAMDSIWMKLKRWWKSLC